MIPFNQPYLTGKENAYILEAVQNKKLSGNGEFTKKCHNYFESAYGFKKCLLTTSCTDALEMAAILAGIQPGDEVIVPSYTFVSSANAFVLRGAKIIFADSLSTHPNIDHNVIRGLITKNTKAIVVVHYAGVACEMDQIMNIANENDLFVIEDAAQAIDSYYKGKPLGSIGHFGAFSFHETKNVISGEGGMLTINDEKFIERAEIIWEKGTNRSSFFRGEVNKYEWVDIGSSFLPSELNAAFLYAQLENLENIQEKRLTIWKNYFEQLIKIDSITLPVIPEYATNNGHMFYFLCKSEEERNNLISYLKGNGVFAVFHYLSLHDSPYYNRIDKNTERLINTFIFEKTLIRLPFFFELDSEAQEQVIKSIVDFFN